MCSTLREVTLEPSQRAVWEKLLSCLPSLPLPSVPALVYQLLLLSRPSPSLCPALVSALQLSLAPRPQQQPDSLESVESLEGGGTEEESGLALSTSVLHCVQAAKQGTPWPSSCSSW